MPEKLKTSVEVVFAIMTLVSTMTIPWGLLFLKVVVGFLTYFLSRMVYRYYKKDIDAFVDSLKRKK
ncbi:hypothetical protein [Flagellimonas nanhaiensis]|uniref:Uncharacterized protein n=1 Tax=Flagellimonas nanhaiensis TaxID=2292706 RepID=A0A371JLD1_9FLAO|nr:hypothetical protein [Allomuricauda nanhaiensis]RDY57729.1 hypothetical protein DX873_17680 [Allomuricauda nanhaiensis]